MYDFFFNDTATTEIYTLSLHDALPIWGPRRGEGADHQPARRLRTHLRLGQKRLGDPPERGRSHGALRLQQQRRRRVRDRKSTRLNSSHANISYAVFCLKTKNTKYSTSR